MSEERRIGRRLHVLLPQFQVMYNGRSDELGVVAVFRLLEFKPGRKGLGKVLGDLEAEIMEEVWARGTCTVRDIYEGLRMRRRIAYTTVMTVMSRLAEKGLLAKGKEGAAFVYRPQVSKDEFRREVAAEVITGLLDGFGKEAIFQLVSAADRADPEIMEQLERAIAERRKKK
ncbi:MAG: BlaI/MecI/CopY family transcriptional regulator [Firmicutes bacterium]|jgi:predicted transcriptional regulator|nr:BlaI/MecI/CopY family transcriptional regulator [Bacillota bacterium]MDH7496309.1 BlaI/MecI/CopY family transcriptional regulator [Bacillota bacterium]